MYWSIVFVVIGIIALVLVEAMSAFNTITGFFQHFKTKTHKKNFVLWIVLFLLCLPIGVLGMI